MGQEGKALQTKVGSPYYAGPQAWFKIGDVPGFQGVFNDNSLKVWLRLEKPEFCEREGKTPASVSVWVDPARWPQKSSLAATDASPSLSVGSSSVGI